MQGLDRSRHMVFLVDKASGEMRERTRDVAALVPGQDLVNVTFTSGKTFPYPQWKVDHRTAEPEPIDAGTHVFVDGGLYSGVRSISRFGDRTIVTTDRGGKVTHYSHPTSAVTTVEDDSSRSSQDILAYWRALTAALPADDPTRKAFKRLGDIHPQSALARYLSGNAVPTLDSQITPIYPFSSNLSQRQAAATALTHPISVIQGPPGTGKTQTILNLVASMVAAGDRSVGVISYTNAAVDNVRRRLANEGIDFITAGLGKKDNKAAFIADQQERNLKAGIACAPLPSEPPLSEKGMSKLNARLDAAQEKERARAALAVDLRELKLEHAYFERHNLGENSRRPKLSGLASKNSGRILEFLAESSVATEKPGLIARIRRYFKYGSTKDLDTDGLEVILELQNEFYWQRQRELQREYDRLDSELTTLDVRKLQCDHRDASQNRLQLALHERYGGRKLPVYGAASEPWKKRDFWSNYPVILSSCHGLASSTPRGELLDLLIIDEASQVSLLAAVPALARARNVVIVGDERQLPHIASDLPKNIAAPHPAYDARSHSLLTSVIAAFADAGGVPSTLLKEHYRCLPAIIGYCNKAFYGGELVVYTDAAVGESGMKVHRTPEGGHQREPDTGGVTNQREIDIITKEVIPTLALSDDDTVGYIAPYRAQVNKMAEQIDLDRDGNTLGRSDLNSEHVNTVHKFQGQERTAIVMSTVIDNTRRGRMRRKFVDEPRLINVAVSRAQKNFILVTHHSLHPGSRYLRDLIDYIDYQNDGEGIIDSTITSVFDLLYTEYSSKLEALNSKVKPVTKFKSENIAWTLLEQILHDEGYTELSAARQYRLRNLFKDRNDLSPEQQRFIHTTASVDFLVYRTVGLRPLLAIEVDGWKYHENDREQQRRDRLKDSIFALADLPILRLPTTGSGEEERIKDALRNALAKEVERYEEEALPPADSEQRADQAPPRTPRGTASRGEQRSTDAESRNQ